MCILSSSILDFSISFVHSRETTLFSIFGQPKIMKSMPIIRDPNEVVGGVFLPKSIFLIIADLSRAIQKIDTSLRTRTIFLTGKTQGSVRLGVFLEVRKDKMDFFAVFGSKMHGVRNIHLKHSIKIGLVCTWEAESQGQWHVVSWGHGLPFRPGSIEFHYFLFSLQTEKRKSRQIFMYFVYKFENIKNQNLVNKQFFHISKQKCNPCMGHACVESREDKHVGVAMTTCGDGHGCK